MPLLPLSLSLILGILLSYTSGENPGAAALLISSFFILSLLYLLYCDLFQSGPFRKWMPVISFSLAFLLIGFGKTALVKGAAANPGALSNAINFGTVFKTKVSESGYQTIHIELDKSAAGNRQTAVRGNLILTLDTLLETYAIGDVVAFRTEIESFRTETNPGSFDAEYYYGTHHYIGRAFIASNLIVKTGSAETISTFFSKWQDEIGASMKRWLPESVAGIGVALLLGNKADIDQEVLDSFSNTGAMHVLAVSGLHVGIILIIFQYILGFFSKWITKKQAILFSVVLIWGFGLLSGASASVIRAVVMFSILALGQLLSRNYNGMNNLILSAIVLLLYDPFYLFDIGFQLSYVALIGIMLFQRPIYQLIFVKRRWIDWLWQGTAVGIAATIATTPFMLYWFGQFPNYFLLSNVVVMLLGFIVLLFLIVLIFTAWVPYLNIPVIFLTVVSLQGLIIGIHYVNRVPGGVSGGFELNFVQFLIIGTLIGLFSYQLLTKRILPKRAGIGLCICLVFISWKREERFHRNELHIFSGKSLCGMIQYKGELIAFMEKTPKDKQILQTLKNAVRNSGLNMRRHVVLESGNTLSLDNKEITFHQENDGWKVAINGTPFLYRSRGIPEKTHDKRLLSQGLQQYLYKNEQIEPFRISL